MIPQKFLDRMEVLLGEEYPAFLSALSEHSERGFRRNRLKCSEEDFIGLDGLCAEPLDYVDCGYVLSGDSSGIGNTPSHHSGRIYVQDPGAMAAAAALDVKEGMWVLDLCAAPGGKSTQIAATLGDSGFILSNEYVPKRAKILVGNFERMGIRNGMVTSLDTAEAAKLFSAVFDIVVVDAPCSGEGMFRKDVPAVEEWSEENVSLCRARQKEILNNAKGTVKSGGKLLYSTCTYSIEENEAVVDEFLANNPDFTLIEVKEELRRVTSDGIVFKGAFSSELSKCRRFYPHVSRGEGQFIALMQRTSLADPEINYKDAAKPLSRAEREATYAFFRENLKEIPRGRVVKHGENIVLISHGCPLMPKSVFSAGVKLGELHGKVLVPSHQFYSAYGNLFIRQENIENEALARRYIAGEEIPATFSSNGFCAVLFRSSPIGGGKASGGVIKNHYPKGLRKPL